MVAEPEARNHVQRKILVRSFAGIFILLFVFDIGLRHILFLLRKMGVEVIIINNI